MKNVLPIVICLILFSCKEQKNTITKEPEMAQEVDSPKKWLTYEGADENAKHIVLISGDEEYRSEEALPQLAKILSKHHGFKCTVLFAQEEDK
ncbi:hypothetical protein [Zobellia laminariae]|nr:hypothetical protein [Zobellia laminariae]WKX77336.1 hypothetical protein Q5W13_04485 [Zobellia laminariae]